jgi:hypothetical protein
MKDVPFYFTIKAFGQMFMDIICVFLRVIFLIPLLFLTLSTWLLPLGVPMCNQVF